jgi:hypothetical protein
MFVNVRMCHDIKMTFWKSEEEKRNFKIDATIAIPENYNIRRIVEALIDELERGENLDSGKIQARIIDEGRPD